MAPAAYWGIGQAPIAVTNVALVGSLRSMTGVEVHVLWKDFGIKSRLDKFDFVKDEVIPELKKSFVKRLKRELVAKSITAHG